MMMSPTPIASPPQEPPTRRETLHERGMATALSIDQWQATQESRCDCPLDPSLSVNFICAHPAPKPSTSTSPPVKSVAARYQEILMDLVGMSCAWLDAGCRHVLDDRFDSFLDRGERDFKDSLLQFLNQQTPDAASTRAYEYLEEMLRSKMGFQTQRKRVPRRTFERVSQEPQPMESPQPKVTSDCATGNMDSDPGHVFVCLSSVCDLQCDAFLMPCSIQKKREIRGSIVHQWTQRTVNNNEILSKTFSKNDKQRWNSLRSYDEMDRVATFEHWPWQELQTSSLAPVPFPVAGEVSFEKSQELASMQKGGHVLPEKDVHIETLLEMVRQFLHVALLELERHQPRPHVYRDRYLLALPVLGTGGAQAGDLTGLIVENLLQELTSYAMKQSKMDIVLVCADEATYAHAQIIRHKNFTCPDDDRTATNNIFLPCFHDLTLDMQQDAQQLATLASQRHLALFLGAGVSIGSGLPSWFGLLHYIEDCFTPTGDPSERKMGDQTGWDPLLMADHLKAQCDEKADRNGTKQSLKERVCTYISTNGQRPGLLLALLISLPCHSMVTQNYDTLIERACSLWNTAGLYHDPRENMDASKTNLSVIPYQPRRNAQYWLLKMHGCVSAPEEIVLTTSDYTRYDSSRHQALGGLVQASLMTKHLLFVGFSLTDPNYLRIIEQVRNALLPNPQEVNKVESSVSTSKQ
eukprot:scaffold2388_cov163-Amphora_coffeaeformis.AAC.2